MVIPYRGNTDLFIDENYKMKIADGLLTGFHEPRASHLNMLQSIAGYEHIDMAYREAIKSWLLLAPVWGFAFDIAIVIFRRNNKVAVRIHAGIRFINY